MNLLKSVVTVGGLTLVSRVLGFVRDIMIAALMGVGTVADAWAVAFRFPNLFRRLFGEGAFNSAFVPIYAKRYEGEGEASADRFAEAILSVLLTILLGVTAIIQIAMPWIMVVYAPGFVSDPAKLELATQLTIVAFPYLIFMSLSALYAGILNTHGRFGWATAVQALLNVGLIIAMLLVWTISAPAMGSSLWGWGLAWGVAASGAAQFVFLVLACARDGIVLRLHRPRLTPDVKHLFALAVPGIIAGGVSQISIFVATVVASLQDGAPAILYYADRVYQFPLGIIGVAMGVVLLPSLSRHLRGERLDLARYWQNRGIELSMLLTLPAAVALVTISQPIVVALFERGAFTREDSVAVANVLIAFGFGLPAFILNKVLTPAYFAREDTATPMRFAVVTLAMDVAMSVGFFFLVGVAGIAIGTSVAAWINVVLLWATLRKRGHVEVDDRLRERMPRIAAASLAMGAGLLALEWGLAPVIGTGALAPFLLLGALCGAGLGIYVICALAIRAATIGELRQALLRG